MRLLVVMIEVVAKSRQTSGILLHVRYRHLESTALDLHKKANGTRMVFRRVVQNLKQRPSRRTDDVVNVSRDKEQDDQKDGASKGADADTSHHDFGALNRSVGDFCQGPSVLVALRVASWLPSIMWATAS